MIGYDTTDDLHWQAASLLSENLLQPAPYTSAQDIASLGQ